MDNSSSLELPSFDSLELKQNQLNRLMSECICEQILLVDDSEIIRMILSELLINNSYSFKTANNGQEALQIVNQRRRNSCCKEFQVIIMDCEMPVLDGWKATKAIRQMGYQGAIVGYTAYSFDQDVQRCLQAGMNNVLFKPSQSSTILQEIRKYDL